MPIYHVTTTTSASLILSAEAAGAAAFRAGLAPGDNPHRASCDATALPLDGRARRDLEKFFEQLVPEDIPWFEHTAEGADDSTSHIRSVLTRSSEVIPILDGRAQLGTWQGIFLFEHRRAPHRREIVLSIVGDSGS